jgi:hypothetical protein
VNDLCELNRVGEDDRLRSPGSRAAVKTILFLCPTMWDEAELPRIIGAGNYRVTTYGTDVSEHP